MHEHLRGGASCDSLKSFWNKILKLQAFEVLLLTDELLLPNNIYFYIFLCGLIGVLIAIQVFFCAADTSIIGDISPNVRFGSSTYDLI